MVAREADKVWLVFFHMTGITQQWYYMLERDAIDSKTGVPEWDTSVQGAVPSMLHTGALY